MKKLSFKIAYCGITTALCLLVLFSTGIFPFSMYLMPVIASVLLLFINDELGAKWAWLSFLAVSILSFIITPDMEAKFMFTFVLGWYPLVREHLVKIKPKAVSFIVRIGILNLATFICYYILIKAFSMTELLETGGTGVAVFIVTTLFIAEFFFIVFDILIGRLTVYYKLVLSKKLRKRIK